MSQSFKPSTPEPARARYPDGRVRAAALFLLSGLMTITAVRIEILNAKAGGLLPVREFRSNTGTAVKWRQSGLTTESRWRELVGPKDEAGNPVQRDLTPAEHDAMREDLRRAKAGNTLREVVASWGVLQYPLVAAGFLFGASLVLSRRARRSISWFGGLGMCPSTAAGVLTVHREYWESLGW